MSFLFHRSSKALNPAFLRAEALRFRAIADMYFSRPWSVGAMHVHLPDTRTLMLPILILFWVSNCRNAFKMVKDEADSVVIRRWGRRDDMSIGEDALDLVRARLTPEDQVLARGFWEFESIATLFFATPDCRKPLGVDLPDGYAKGH